LEVSSSSDTSAIKEAFFKKSKEVHPDLNPDDPEAQERFQQLAAAYEVIIIRLIRQINNQFRFLAILNNGENMTLDMIEARKRPILKV